MTWSGEVTLGVVAQVVLLCSLGIAGWTAVKSRLAVLESILENHSRSVGEHAARLVHYEGTTTERLRQLECSVAKLIVDLQRVISDAERRRSR